MSARSTFSLQNGPAAHCRYVIQPYEWAPVTGFWLRTLVRVAAHCTAEITQPAFINSPTVMDNAYEPKYPPDVSPTLSPSPGVRCNINTLQLPCEKAEDTAFRLMDMILFWERYITKMAPILEGA